MNKLEVCRQATILCGEQPLQSLDEGSIAANYLSDRYDSVINTLLNETYWTFTLKRTELQKDPSISDLEFENAYKLPNDFLRLKQFLENIKKEIYIPKRFDFVGRNILCDEDKIAIEYSSLIDDSNLPFYLNNVVEYALASDIAYALTENASLGQKFEQKYQLALRQAKTIDAQHERPTKMWTSNYLKLKNNRNFFNGRN